jgi:hypothetical protein
MLRKIALMSALSLVSLASPAKADTDEQITKTVVVYARPNTKICIKERNIETTSLCFVPKGKNFCVFTIKARGDTNFAIWCDDIANTDVFTLNETPQVRITKKCERIPTAPPE